MSAKKNYVINNYGLSLGFLLILLMAIVLELLIYFLIDEALVRNILLGLCILLMVHCILVIRAGFNTVVIDYERGVVTHKQLIGTKIINIQEIKNVSVGSKNGKTMVSLTGDFGVHTLDFPNYADANLFITKLSEYGQ